MKVDETAEEYLDRIPMWAKKKNSLEDIREFLCEMGGPDEKMKIFHVAGTNGKGSVCAFLHSVLTAARCRVGTFTSPHLIETRERFLINGEKVHKTAFEDSCRTVRTLSERMMEKGYCHPSYFEFLFYMAMDMFYKAGVDFVILETGLGGRIDATNVIRHPLVSVITSISLDHTEYLGDTVDKIAAEKAGIIKKGIPVVFDGNDREASAVIRNRARELSAPFYEVDRQGYEITGCSDKGFEAVFYGKDGDPLPVTVPSRAEYQVMNALLAYRALEAADLKEGFGLKIGSELFGEGIGHMRWPARMEEALPGVFLDGAHNPGGIRAFAEAAAGLCAEREKRAYLLFSAVTDKDHDTMIRNIARALPLDQVAVAHIDSVRGIETEVLLKEFRNACGCRAKGFQTVEEAVRYMLHSMDEEHLLFCVGSLYLMGEIKAVLRRNGYD
ncbi:folylpolyglutamate synthase/dihydrofolate synthase family protein [Lachnospiraceae bacterium 54-53]